MKQIEIGDLVKVKRDSWAPLAGEIGIIIEEIFPDSKTNKGKAFRVLFKNGLIRPQLRKQLEILNESR